ncbi:MAG: hypothetical protein GXP29_15125 [Planctomycetes bacterium]|nr:hypothetical protein [Planctomycetota bacterium]
MNHEFVVRSGRTLLSIWRIVAFADHDGQVEAWMDYTEEQFEYDMLLKRWRGFEQRSFPAGWGGVEVAGICLVMLDADMAGLVSSYVERRRPFRLGGIDYLRQLHEKLRSVLPSLTGDAADYFAEWDGLVATTLYLLERG